MTADQIVASLRAKSPGALAELLDSYGAELFQYCWCMLRSRDIAQIALRDTLVAAEAQIARLTEPELLGTWLHSLARAECRRRRPVAPSLTEDPWPASELSEAGDRSQPGELSEDNESSAAGESSPWLSQGNDDSQWMAWNAALSMAADEFEALELACRHEVDLGLVLGLSAEDAQVLLDRGKQNLERALSAEILVSRGSQACPDLAKLMSGGTGTMTPQIRTRVLEHADGCAVCGPHLPRNVSASRVFAQLPAPALSPLARSEVLAARSSRRPRFPRARPGGILARVGLIAAAAALAAALTIAFVLLRPGAKPAGSSKPAGAQTMVAGAPSGAELKRSEGRPSVRTVVANTAGPQDEALITEVTKPKAPAPRPGAPSLQWYPLPPAITRASAPAGTLTLSPVSISLGTGSTGALTLTAAGGPANWSASAPPFQVSLSSEEGTLQAGQSVTLEITVGRSPAAGSAAISIESPPSPPQTVEVSWTTQPILSSSAPPPTTPPPPPSCPPSTSPPPPSPSSCPSSSPPVSSSTTTSTTTSPSPTPSPSPSPTPSPS